MRRLYWSDTALADFEQALSYLAGASASAAHLVADRIDEAARELCDIPTGRPGRVHGTYEKLVPKTSYVIAYTLSERSLVILRVIHTSRDWREDEWPT